MYLSWDVKLDELVTTIWETKHDLGVNYMSC